MNNIILSIFFLLASAAAFAEPYILLSSHINSNPRGNNQYAIDHIVNKKPIPFDMVSKKNGTETILPPEQSPVNPVKAYNAWFKNLNDRIIAQNRQNEFKFMQDIIDFGMSDQVLYFSDRDTVVMNDGVVLTILDGDDPYWRKLKSLAAGSFDKSLFYMGIYLRTSSPENLQRVLTHEVGHSLAVADSYGGGAAIKDILYSSDLRPSIMDRAIALTCDDADALANALYLTMKHKKKLPLNNAEADFEFKSFCQNETDEEIVFRNGMQINRRPMINFYNGYYYLTEFCKDGKIKTTTKINFRAPLNLLQTTSQSDCEGIAYTQEEPPLPKDETKEYKLVDLTSGKREKIPASKNVVVYEYAPGIVREITFDNEVSQTMVKVKTSDGRLLYVYAILDEGRAFVYSVTDRLMFVYDTRDYKKYTLIQGNANGKSAGGEELISPEETKAIRDFINKGRIWLYGTFESDITLDKYIMEATLWQGYMQKYYPHKDLKIKSIKISKKDMEKFSKDFKNIF